MIITQGQGKAQDSGAAITEPSVGAMALDADIDVAEPSPFGTDELLAFDDKLEADFINVQYAVRPFACARVLTLCPAGTLERNAGGQKTFGVPTRTAPPWPRTMPVCPA